MLAKGSVKDTLRACSEGGTTRASSSTIIRFIGLASDFVFIYLIASIY